MKDRLFPVIFDSAVYPWVKRRGATTRDICVPKCEALQTRKGSFFWRITTLAMVLGLSGVSVWVCRVVAGGLFMYKRRHKSVFD